MLQSVPGGRTSEPDPRTLDSADLVSLCVADTSDSELWSEFVRRFGPKIRAFIRGTLRQSSSPFSDDQENDLFQNTIVRLVSNDCAVLRRFSGTSDAELHAYLAVIARSAVRDSMKYQRRQKRPPAEDAIPLQEAGLEMVEAIERGVLAREISDLIGRMLKDLPARDRLIFQLHYQQGLSTAEIARCDGVGLTQRGVVYILNRLTDQLRTAVGPSVPQEMRP